MRTAQENLENFGRMVDTRADKPKMLNQMGFINSRPPAKLDAIFADMLVALGNAVNRERRDCEGLDGEGI